MEACHVYLYCHLDWKFQGIISSSDAELGGSVIVAMVEIAVSCPKPGQFGLLSAFVTQKSIWGSQAQAARYSSGANCFVAHLIPSKGLPIQISENVYKINCS